MTDDGEELLEAMSLVVFTDALLSGRTIEPE